MVSNPIEFFTTCNKAEILNTGFLKLEQSQKGDKRAFGYHLEVIFSFKFTRNDSKIYFFPFQKLCYDRADDGYYKLNADKMTEEVFKAWRIDSMSDDYVDSAWKVFSSLPEDIFVLQPMSQFKPLAQDAGYSNHADTLRVQERFLQNNRLGKILQMLPMLNISLNSNQARILNAPVNMFILGRSGTGKTTTTVLRAFCQEVLFIAVLKQQRQLNYLANLGLTEKYMKAKRSLPKLTASDIDRSAGVKMVFVTASPVLTNEVKQYYANLKQQLSAHLLVV